MLQHIIYNQIYNRDISKFYHKCLLFLWIFQINKKKWRNKGPMQQMSSVSLHVVWKLYFNVVKCTLNKCRCTVCKLQSYRVLIINAWSFALFMLYKPSNEAINLQNYRSSNDFQTLRTICNLFLSFPGCSVGEEVFVQFVFAVH